MHLLQSDFTLTFDFALNTLLINEYLFFLSFFITAIYNIDILIIPFKIKFSVNVNIS